VLLNLTDADAVRDGYARITDSVLRFNAEAVVEGVLVQKMAPPGEEVILGLNRYPVFGPLIMFGIGGIFVEVFQDVDFRLAPVGRNSARRMIQGIKGYKLLRGFRGRPRVDLEAVERAIVSMSDLGLHHPEILEMDINPMLVHPEGSGATVADCRMVLQPTTDTGPTDNLDTAPSRG
jgi:acetyltransferase